MRLGFLLLLLLAAPAHAALPDCLSEPEFRGLATELAPKVNLFSEAWAKDPAAEFYGGTTRDYLYWIKGKFRDCRSAEEGKRIAAELRAEPSIDVRDFIIGDSDVDIVSQAGVRIDGARYGVKKIDAISPDIFDPHTERGLNETVQGYIPAEKVRLGMSGVRAPEKFGDGLGEIYSGRLTVHFTPASEFAKGHYAKQGVNHPILLALRYQRLLAINYFKTFGAGYPDSAKLFAVDPAAEKAVQAVMASAREEGALKPFFEKEQFRRWLNGAIQKSFRSYTNPTAAKLVLEHYGVDKLARDYPEIEPLNQYVFQRYRDEFAVARNLTQLGADPQKLFSHSFFPDGYLYHGTRTEEAFRGILLQGFLPSENGMGGKGLYGVAEPSKEFSERWGGDRLRLVRIPVKPEAKVVDVTAGEGERIWKNYTATHPADYDAFADFVGADVLRYPYGETEAFVVKNSQALGRPEGVYRKVTSLGEARAWARKVQSPAEFAELVGAMKLNALNEQEALEILRSLPRPPVDLLPSVEDQATLRSLLHSFQPKDAVGKALRTGFGGGSDLLHRVLAGVRTEADFDFIQQHWPDDFIRFGTDEAPALLERLDRSGALASYHGPFADVGELYRKFHRWGINNPFRYATDKQFRPVIAQWLRDVPSYDVIRDFFDERRIEVGELAMKLDSGELKSITEEWRKRGLLQWFASDLSRGAEYHDLKARLATFSANPKVAFPQAFAREVLPDLRAAARRAFPDGAPAWVTSENAPLKRAMLITALTGDGPLDAIPQLYFNLEVPRVSLAATYVKSPFAQLDFTFQRSLLATMHRDPSAWNLIVELLDKDGPFAQSLTGEEVKMILAETKGRMGLLPDSMPNVLGRLRGTDPRAYVEAMKAYFQGEAAEIAEERYFRMLHVLPKQSGDPFLATPEAARWIEAIFLRAEKENRWHSSPEAFLKLLALPEVARLPESRRWIEALLTDQKPFSKNYHVDQALAALFAQEPWVSHPRRAVWTESLKLPREQYNAIVPDVQKAPRAAYVRTRAKFLLREAAKENAWRSSITVGQAAELGNWIHGREARTVDLDCLSLFQRLFLLRSGSAVVSH